jgi:hypothetical protein
MTPKSLEGGTEMATSAANERQELAQRTSDGIQVTLLWTKSTNAITIVVIDSHFAEQLEFAVDGRSALDAFNHPYAYAAAHRARNAPASQLAATR